MNHKARIARSQQQLWTISLAVLGGTLVISLAFFFLFRSSLHYQVLFFPNLQTGELSGERRMLPRYDNTTAGIRQLAEEIILGPVDIHHARVVPRSTRIRNLMERDRVLYIDLSNDILREIEDEASFFAIRDAFEQTLRFNYRTIREVTFTVGGQVPGATRHSGAQRQTERAAPQP